VTTSVPRHRLLTLHLRHQKQRNSEQNQNLPSSPALHPWHLVKQPQRAQTLLLLAHDWDCLATTLECLELRLAVSWKPYLLLVLYQAGQTVLSLIRSPSVISQYRPCFVCKTNPRSGRYELGSVEEYKLRQDCKE
jgi:hypothetical protein